MDKNNELKNKAVNGFAWKFAERISAQMVTFVVSIILARMLSPSDYGVVSIVMVFITIANVFVVNGFGSSLIQKKYADNIDFSSVFYFNILFSILIYFIIYLLAPYISSLYDMSILTPVLRVLGIRIVIAGINSVQQAYVSRNLLFKKFFLSTLFGTILSGIVGILMAYYGYGIWALVGQYLINTIVDTIILWFTVKWRPNLVFSFNRMKEMFSYGWKLLFSALLDTGYTQLRGVIIATLYTTKDLAFYDRGQQYPNLLVTNINSSIGSVLFPIMAKKQESKEMIKNITRKSIQISSYIMWPMMVGLCILAKPVIILMLTDKWLPCVPFLQIACFTYAFWPIHTANLEAIKALGRSDIFLKLEIMKKIIGTIILFISMKYGVVAIALSGIITTITSSFINAYPNKKLLGYSYIEQIKDTIPYMFLSIIMGVCIYPIGRLIDNKFLLIIMQVVIGVLVYLLGSKLFKFQIIEYLINYIKKNKKCNRK